MKNKKLGENNINNIKRILGIDFGDRRTGVAITDLTGTLANGIETIESTGLTDCAKKVLVIAEKYRVSEIVLGYPINMNGTKGESSVKIEKFKEILENLVKPRNENIRDVRDVKVILFDERLSTSLAHVYMNQTGIKSKDRKQKVDMLSAQIILQNYIDSRR